MKDTMIKCDTCGADLTTTGSTPKYRLCLSAEKVPHNTNIIHAVMIYPPLKRDYHYCGLSCLSLGLVR